MNPLTNTKNIQKLSEQELRSSFKSSWHDQYRDSAWIFIGGLPYDLSEGDIIAIFSQYGEIVNINLVRDKDSGKSRGFCFLCYEDQRSTILAVDNFNNIKVLGRTLRVDHVSDYKMPKDGKKTDAETKRLHEEGCAPKAVPLAPPPPREPKLIKMQPQDLRETLVDQIASDIKLPMRLPIYTVKDEISSVITEEPEEIEVKKEKKERKAKKEKKHKKKKKRQRSDSSDSSSSDSDSKHKRKKGSKSNDNGDEKHIKYK
ncbi:hypothetical protein RN001_001208 [Aquatica leii]|uniref:RRM domain-containing protein n=1 Tax=Aquatica leii TaxID=1421715 RepID=A0AAN7PFT8_9COLE|nr:hypothetical protein RN001_001208 [Aquatica leii]